MRRPEKAMIRSICGVRLREKRQSDELRRMIGLNEDIVVIINKSRLRYYGHVKRRAEMCGIIVLDLEVEGERPRGRSNMSWKVQLERDIKANGIGRRKVVMCGKDRLLS